MTIRLSADQCTATMPPVKAVRVRFVAVDQYDWMLCCPRCFFGPGSCCKPVVRKCVPRSRRDGRNGYWAKAKKGKRVGK